MAVRVTVYGEANMKQLARAQRDLDKLKANATKNTSGVKNAFSSMQAGVASFINAYQGVAIAAVAVGAAVYKSVQAYAESEVIQKQLARAVANTGASYAGYDKQLQSIITSTSQMAAVDDELVSQTLTSLIQATGDASTAQKLLGVAMDLSRAKGMDAQKAAILVGKVYNGNVGALKRYGITLKEGATATEALGELQRRYAGYAEDYGKSTAGAADDPATSWGNLRSPSGRSLYRR